MSHSLSKSRYIRGMQCEKAMYLDTYRSDLARISPETRQKFTAGRLFEKIYKDQYPNAIDVSEQLRWRFGEYARYTQQLLERPGEITLFEAGFKYDGVLVLTDVLHRSEDGKIDIFEVKNVGEVNPTIRNDVFVQYYVVSHCLPAINSFNVIYRPIDFAPESENPCFAKEALIDEAREKVAEVAARVARFKEVLQGGEPTIAMGEHCNKPYECPFQQYCSHNMDVQLSLSGL